MSIWRVAVFVLALMSPLALMANNAEVDINSADIATLAKHVKGVGERKAQAIVQYRDEHGPFKSVDELQNVKGIGQKTVDLNRDVLVASPQ